MPGQCSRGQSARRRIPTASPAACRHDQAEALDRIGSGDIQRLERVLHDVNNLLTVIVGSLDDLCTLGPFDPPVCQRINDALEAALRGTELAGTLLPLPKADRG